MARLLPLAILVLAAFAPQRVCAEDGGRAVVVLDRGANARAGAQRLGHRAIRLVAALQRQGHETLLLAAGADAGGRPRFTRPQPTIAGITALDKEPAFSFAGATDACAALETILAEGAGKAPVDVYLLGPFAAPGTDEARRRVALWNERAPDGSRIFPLGLVDGARERLAKARGLQTRGWLVLRFDKPRVETEPYSALEGSSGRRDDVSLSAHVHAAPEVLRVADSGDPPPLVTASTDLDSDTVTARTVESLTLITVARTLRDGRTATVRFKALAPGHVHWLCDPPGPLTFAWDRLQPGARVLGPQRETDPVFEAKNAEAGKPVRVALRLLRSRVGPAPAWRGPDLLPAGLTWKVGPEVRVSDEVGESELRIEYVAEPASPVDEEGVLVLRADGVPEPLRVPYVLQVAPGRAKLEASARTAAVPFAAKELAVVFRVWPQNANMPATVNLELACESAHADWLRARFGDGDGRVTAWPLGQAVAVPVDQGLGLTFDVAPGAPAGLTWPCTVSLRPAAMPGVEVAGATKLEIRMRRPRIVVEGDVPSLTVEDGAVSSDPLVLRLDPDGGDGEWLLGLMKQPPRVARSEGGVETWAVVGHAPGAWHVLPKGAWSGDAAQVFDDTSAVEKLWIEWDGGGAPEPVEMPVAIPARWGATGWLFVGLAALAVALAVGTFVLMRPPPIAGTLLYTEARLPGTVGRLDLSPAGRRPAILSADPRGRLELGLAGEMVARLRPTRVGGMIEVQDADGAWERRLLVDGLSLRAGTHVVRYVSGRPGEAEAQAAMEQVPDLLGPEYDIESGRIESLEG